MDKSFECRCGNNAFWWFFGEYARCTKCYNQYETTLTNGIYEVWERKFDKEQNNYLELEIFKQPLTS